jgi:predicted transcriptional regulator of viral defense system
MRSTTKLGRALAFARANHDLLTTASLRADGLSRSQIGQLVNDRVIERIIRGLYRLAGSRTRLQDIAACLLRHPSADASHVSALFVHDLDIEAPRRPHFTLPERSGGATPLTGRSGRGCG